MCVRVCLIMMSCCLCVCVLSSTGSLVCSFSFITYRTRKMGGGWNFWPAMAINSFANLQTKTALNNKFSGFRMEKDANNRNEPTGRDATGRRSCFWRGL